MYKKEIVAQSRCNQTTRDQDQTSGPEEGQSIVRRPRKERRTSNIQQWHDDLHRLEDVKSYEIVILHHHHLKTQPQSHQLLDDDARNENESKSDHRLQRGFKKKNPQKKKEEETNVWMKKLKVTWD